MSSYSPAIDQYILKAKPFAQIILDHLRVTIHQACPEVEEKLKWGMPFFDYKGKMMCNMAGFSQHCSFGFWKASIMKDPKKVFIIDRGEGMGQFGKITSIKDLPSTSILKSYIKEAMKLNDEEIVVPKPPKVNDNSLPQIPDYFLKALKKEKPIHENFTALSPACQREYVQWITEAKTEATRLKRMNAALDWIAEGKKRNWKYEVG
jgi:uncharacterized protein YdeI (YjbR/CyaY-like superfamily)